MLVICGNHSKAHLDPVFQTDNEIWVFNGKGATLPRYDAVFQMHLAEDWGGQWSRRWLRENNSVPVFMREVYPEIPMSVRYPFEDVFGMLGNVRHRGKPLKYFTSSIAWAIALAVLHGRTHIRAIGIEMNEWEYETQKDCFAFWIGFAAGRGLQLDIDCADNIFTKVLYGSEPLAQ